MTEDEANVPDGMDGMDGMDGPWISWEVGSDLIDLDHWGRSYVAVRVAAQEHAFSPFVRYGFWPILALTMIVVGFTTSAPVPVAIGPLVAVVVAYLGAKVWNRGQADRMAERLRTIPAASEPFTFRATRFGTESRGASGANDLAWSRYTGAGIHDDLIFLRQDTGALLFLPVAGLTSPHTPTRAVQTISTWIEAARSSA